MVPTILQHLVSEIKTLGVRKLTGLIPSFAFLYYVFFQAQSFLFKK